MKKSEETISVPSIARAEEIRMDLERLRKEEARLAHVLAASRTREHLYVRMCGNAAKWYVIKDGVRTYLPKSERPKAVRLAQLAWCQARLAEVRAEIEACENYLIAFRSRKTHLHSLMENSGFRELISSVDSDAKAWVHAEYETNPKCPENLQYMTSSGLKVRSKSEIMIAASLEKYGIPFRYECLLETPAGPFYPDFTIRHPQTGKLYIWEHFGMIDDNAYAATSLPKIGVYAQMGFFPGDNLLMTFETKERPFNQANAEALVCQYFPTPIGRRSCRSGR